MSGTVVHAGWMNGYGNVVIVNHGEISTLYAHNSKLLVSVGQQVQGGQQISVVGSTGWSTGPHIHFEVRDSRGEKMDPTSYYIY
ncbi:Murein hydrolase activator EnvC [bioreactor metagenome]|uniref:Murein hydrolase activator EnvC n=1 Tax=bioreactor metagenome TaxID=1076179 RepID=A0A645CA51_9ZZZZ